MAPNLRPSAMPEHYVIAAPARALDGTLRPHVLKSGATPILFTDWTVRVKIDNQSQLSTWASYLGKVMYFVPNYHDQAAHDSYDCLVFVEKVDPVESPGPTQPVMYLNVRLVDAD
ncbi:MAG: hypothetical protein GWN58_27690 [Anaerolineae bacterium]|nr:hypothetical protein [Anaerolineae bacterium]